MLRRSSGIALADKVQNRLASFEKQSSDQPEGASVRFSQKPRASALRLIFKCNSYSSNDAH